MTLPLPQDYVLVVGGAGFIGSNLSSHLMQQGKRVKVFDSLARPGVESNLRWLHDRFPDRVLVQIADIRNQGMLQDAVHRASAVYHLGAQVAVTTSIADPVHDFEINAQGTLNLLEALRAQKRQVPLLFTSTNKVYGDLADIGLHEQATRYVPGDAQIAKHGINELRSLAFHSPYGCSKGTADQYILDYAHTYDMPATVFRMSCIYGPRQFGTEDQGWVAHFLLRALQNQPITIYGDGKQVRDILFIDDLVEALQLGLTHIDRTSGQAFNIGGGPANVISLLELLTQIENLQDGPVSYSFDGWRRGDQRYYVSDTTKFTELTGWSAQVSIEEGLARLYRWLKTIQTPVPVASKPLPSRINGQIPAAAPSHTQVAAASTTESIYGD